MHPPTKFSKIINRKKYDVETATLIAGNDYWDGNNFERGGTNQFLYSTPKNAYFFVFLTQWQGARDRIEPCTQDEAIEAYEGGLSEHRVDYKDAFPGVEVEEA